MTTVKHIRERERARESIIDVNRDNRRRKLTMRH